MELKDTKTSSMIFSPLPRRKRRLQLRISERRLVLMLGDTLAVILAILFSLGIWAYIAKYPFDLQFLSPQVIWFFVLTGLWFLLASANDYYELAIAANRLASLQRLVMITLQLLVVYIVVFFLSDRNSLPRLFIIYYGISSFFALLIARMLNPALIGWASSPRHVLIVGTDWAAETLIDTLNYEAQDSYQIMGIIGTEAEVGKDLRGIPVIGSGADLLNYVTRDQISEIIMTSTREVMGDVFQAVMDAYERGVAITPMPILYERITGRVPVEHVGDNWAVVLPMNGTSVFNPYPFLHRITDILISGIGLLCFALLLPFIALAIRLDSKGGIFYSQERVGLNGRLFKIVKLRTMVHNAEAATGAVFAVSNDPRITKVGRWMRKTRLDEVPQLWNVLKGDMSMIGPRPERPEHVQRLQASIPFYRTRHIIRPGLTGWAQVRYHYGSDDKDALMKLQYDLYYIRHQSILLDLNILIRTVGQVVQMTGV